MRTIAIERSDGGVSIMALVGKADAAAEVAKWQQSAGGVSVVSVREIDRSSIPTDRTYRNAWKVNGHAVDHDMPKARAIHRDRLRAARSPLLAALDQAYLRADEEGNTTEKQRIAAEKRRLRDVTADPRIDQAQTIEELKAVWPL